MLLDKIKAYKTNCFTQFLAYLQRLGDLDPLNQAILVIDKQNYFKATIFALGAMIKAYQWLKKFVALDACHIVLIDWFILTPISSKL